MLAKKYSAKDRQVQDEPIAFELGTPPPLGAEGRNRLMWRTDLLRRRDSR